MLKGPARRACIRNQARLTTRPVRQVRDAGSGGLRDADGAGIVEMVGGEFDDLDEATLTAALKTRCSI
jgi:hypothetical protein